jgi:[ribosomal protein S5]-alanine N-acetyltransferase
MRALETVRLHLRPLGAEDETLYCQLYTDPLVMRHIAMPLSADAARRSFRAACRQAERQPLQRRTWVMTEADTAIDIGLLALVDDPEAMSSEIGALLLDDWQNRGYAAEAIEALVAYAFRDLELAAVHTRHAGENGPAAGLMRKLGFVAVAPDPRDGLECRWRLTPAEWRPGG